MSRRFKRLLGGTVVLAILGVAGFIAFQVVAGAGEGPAQPGNLAAPNRTHLSLCVDAAGGGTVTSGELDAVSTAVDAALASLDQIPPEFGQPSVAAGCPPPIPLTGKRLDSNDLCCGFLTAVADADLLSPHRLFTYFVPDSTYAASFGEEPFARARAEALCRDAPRTIPSAPLVGLRDNVCSVMTVSLYLPSSAGTDVIAQGILRALALDEREPEPTFDLQAFVQSCEQGTPQPGCDRYLACLMGTPSEAQCNNLWRELGLEPAE